MNVIEYKVSLPDGSVANTVGPNDIINAMYPMGQEDLTPLYVGEGTIDPSTGARLTSVNSALRFQKLPEGRTAISGNTVTRLCPVAESCGSCALAGQGLSVTEMSDKNCARANTASAFEMAGVPPEASFMMTPVPTKDKDGRTFNDYYVVDHDRLMLEMNGDELMQYKLDPAYAVVFTKSWLEEQGLDKKATGMQGADGSMGEAIAVFDDPLDDETLFIPFCSLRENMGDREEKDQIVRGALNAYFDSKGYDESARRRLASSMRISVNFSASASLKNFAHNVQLPEEGSEKAERIRSARPELVEQAGGRLTTAIVLDEGYAGAMLRGNVWPGIEAQMDGIGPNPIAPDRCPGDGQSCHVDYRAETEYTIRKQLRDMGVLEENVFYDVTDVLDPADASNNAASNRREQNGLEVGDARIGVDKRFTNRTLNAMVVEI